MAEVFRDEAALNGFLHVMHEAYVAGEEQKLELPNGFIQDVVEEGPFRMVDTYHSNEDDSIFAGDYVVFVDGQPVWHNGYHALITDPEALRFYFEKVVENPDPNLPIVGQYGLRNDALNYAWWPLSPSGFATEVQPTLGRYILAEHMLREADDTNVYESIHNGGWL